MNKLHRSRVGVLGLLFTSCSSIAVAGISDASTPRDTVGDIVVTAQKRSESINKVPMAISALQGSALKAEGVHSLSDLANVIPGLTFAPSLFDTPVYSLRGVGFYETSLAGYPDVSVYVDQVPLSFPSLTTYAGLDLERVEVLKGPQGILFGQNATGGAINYIAAKPTNTMKAGIEVGYGRFNTVDIDGFVSGPLSDTVKARLAFQTENAEGWQHTYFMNPGATNGAVQRSSARLLVDWTPSDKLKFELNLNGGVDRSEPIAPQLIGVAIQQPSSPGFGPFLANYPLAPADAAAADFTLKNKPMSNNNQYQASLRADYHLTSDLTLTSISAYTHYNRNEHISFGGVGVPEQELTQDNGFIEDIFQELRLANNPSNSIRWIIGANFNHSHVFDLNGYDFSASSAADTLGITGNPVYSDQTMNNYAVFGNADWDLSHQFTISAGVRYTESNRHAKLCTEAGATGGAGPLFDYLMSVFHNGAVYPPLQPTDCLTLDPVTLLSVRPGFIDNLNEANFSPRINVSYKPTSNLLLYINVTKGYKAGSFPTASASTTYQYLPVRQESVLDYEGGFKLGLFEHTLQLNGAGFHYDYSNKQIRTNTLQPIFGILNNLQNVPKSTIDGGELDLAWTPIRGLHLTAAGTYLRGTITQFIGTNGDGVRQDYAGTVLPFTPKLSANATIDYTFDLSERLQASVGATYTHRDSSFATVGPSQIDQLNPYDLLDLRAGIATKDGRYRVDVWGKNVTNKFYWNDVLHSYDVIVRYAAQPVTYGVRLSAQF